MSPAPACTLAHPPPFFLPPLQPHPHIVVVITPLISFFNLCVFVCSLCLLSFVRPSPQPHPTPPPHPTHTHNQLPAPPPKIFSLCGFDSRHYLSGFVLCSRSLFTRPAFLPSNCCRRNDKFFFYRQLDTFCQSNVLVCSLVLFKYGHFFVFGKR